MRCEIDEVVAAMEKREVALLIGAGCSASAKIPVASELVQQIRKDYPGAYNRAPVKTYPACMANLAPGFRRLLIGDQVDKAKINWAHIAIAQLIDSGHIDCVLTTNFDPLVLKACALFHRFPAVYDFAVSQVFNRAYVSTPAVFYLHGQRNGFAMLNTDEECSRYSESMRRLFEYVGEQRVWVVVGYSGECDPVFEQLSQMGSFEYGLFWVCHRNEEPCSHVRNLLLDRCRWSGYIQGYNADEFFLSLSQRLKLSPPDFIVSPSASLDRVVAQLCPFPLLGHTVPLDACAKALQRHSKLVEEHHDQALEVLRDLMAGEYERACSVVTPSNSLPEELAEVVSWAQVLLGDELMGKASAANGVAAVGLLAKARDAYGTALRIRPEMPEALIGQGQALLARSRSMVEGDRVAPLEESHLLFERAHGCPGYEYRALLAWAGSLVQHADLLGDDEEADKWFEKACRRFEEAVQLQPGNPDAYVDWGHALSAHAATKARDESIRLFDLAAAKCKTALDLTSATHRTLACLGNAYAGWARVLDGSESDRYFTEARSRFSEALDLKPDMHEAMVGWGNALSEQAKKRDGNESDRLFEEAYAVYQKAFDTLDSHLGIHKVLMAWATSLLDRARRRSSPEFERLHEEAYHKYELARGTNADPYGTYMAWGDALRERAQKRQDSESDRLYEEAYRKYEAAISTGMAPSLARLVLADAFAERAIRRTGDEAKRLLELASITREYAAGLDDGARGSSAELEQAA